MSKAFRVLELFNQSRRKLTLTQIAHEADMDLSSAQRFVNTLVHLRYLQKDAGSRLYSLTFRVLELGHHYTLSDELIERATPHLQTLSLATEETVNLSVLDDEDVVIVSRLVSRHVLRPEITTGARLPALLTSSGHALLSGLSDEALRERIASSHVSRNISAEKVIQCCHEIREKGYSCISDGYFPNDITLAAPIFNAHGEPHAALSISVSKLRWTPERAEAELAPRLLDTARPISLVNPFWTSRVR
ncbi:IclR family transcriptional regulator [Achromobacter aloeverae]